MRKNKGDKKGIIIYVVLGFFLVVALVMILWEPIKSLIRQNVIEDNIKIIESNISDGNPDITVEIPLTDSLSIAGEDTEDEEDLDSLFEDIAEYSGAKKSLHCLGILEVPSINVKEPVYAECDRVSLRYGVAHYPNSADFGTNGNATILGPTPATYLPSSICFREYLIKRS